VRHARLVEPQLLARPTLQECVIRRTLVPVVRVRIRRILFAFVIHEVDEGDQNIDRISDIVILGLRDSGGDQSPQIWAGFVDRGGVRSDIRPLAAVGRLVAGVVQERPEIGTPMPCAVLHTGLQPLLAAENESRGAFLSVEREGVVS
jgi:hypothetical protein